MRFTVPWTQPKTTGLPMAWQGALAMPMQDDVKRAVRSMRAAGRCPLWVVVNQHGFHLSCEPVYRLTSEVGTTVVIPVREYM